MGLEPLFDRILVERDKQQDKKGSIYLPETAKAQELNTGVVLAVGPKVTDLKPGDRIVFAKFAGQEILHDNRTFVEMKEEDARLKIT